MNVVGFCFCDSVVVRGLDLARNIDVWVPLVLL